MPAPQAAQKLRRMVGSIHHESFYEAGAWTDPSLGVYVGWTARKNSFSEGMPLRNEKRDVVLVFSGEEFPAPGTSRRLREKGHTLDTKGPSYLVHLYEEDASFPACLNGRFNGLLTDRTKGTSTLFNDRFGMHRIYYHESKDAFYFATEAKAILSVLPELRTVDARGLGEFISCGCVLEDRTLFKNIHVLPPGAAWVFRQSAIERKSVYFQPKEWENQEPLDPEIYYQQIREVFSRTLPRYFEGGEKIGMSLTGGLDTRMIMAWQRSPPGTLPCYSFGGMFRDCQDVILARKVARMCGQSHQVIPVGNEFLSRFRHYAERTVYVTDGCANVTRSSDLYANEYAAGIAPIRMTGNYGSEILRRVVAFKPTNPHPSLFQPETLDQVHAARQTYSELRRGHALSFIAFRQAPWHHHSLRALEETQLSLRSPFLDNELVRTAFRAPGAAQAKTNIFAPEDEWVRLIAEGNPELRRLRTDRGLAGASGHLSAALSRSVLEFTFKAEYAYDYGMPQSLARIDHALSFLHLERLFLGRHKFNHFRLWYRDSLSEYVQEMLLDPQALSRPYLERKAVATMVRGHVSGNGNYTSEIHTLLTLELIHRLFVDAQEEPVDSVSKEAIPGVGDTHHPPDQPVSWSGSTL
jgi:asparagine synthase (glutamine-hydrolysing)